MPRPPRPAARAADEEPGPIGAPQRPGADPSAGPARPPAPSLAGLGVAGITRRRVAWAGLTAFAAWTVLSFAGQAAAAARADADLASARARNAEIATATAALRGELALVQQDRWSLQQARAYQLGSIRERRFVVAPDAPPLPPDAPGSPARRLGAEPAPPSPLESWLDVLFGPAPGG